MRKKISQAEAWGMKHQLRILKEQDERRRNSYGQTWPDGVHLVSINIDPVVDAKLKTARKLRHTIVAITPNNGQVDFYAIPNK